MEIAVINCRLQQLFLCVICSGKWYLFRKLMTPFINLRSHPLIKRTATRLKWPPGPAGVGPAAAQLRPQQNTTIHWLIKTAALLEKNNSPILTKGCVPRPRTPQQPVHSKGHVWRRTQTKRQKPRLPRVRGGSGRVRHGRKVQVASAMDEEAEVATTIDTEAKATYVWRWPHGI